MCDLRWTGQHMCTYWKPFSKGKRNKIHYEVQRRSHLNELHPGIKNIEKKKKEETFDVIFPKSICRKSAVRIICGNTIVLLSIT